MVLSLHETCCHDGCSAWADLHCFAICPAIQVELQHMCPGGDRELQLSIMKGVGLAKVLPIHIEFGMAWRYGEIQIC